MVANSGSFVRRRIRLDVFHKTKFTLRGLTCKWNCILLNLSVDPAFEKTPKVTLKSFPSERFIRAGRKEGYLTIFQIAD